MIENSTCRTEKTLLTLIPIMIHFLSSLRTRSWKKIAFKHLFQPNYFNLSSLIVRQFLVKEPVEPLEELMEE